MPTGKPTKMKTCKLCNELFLPETPSTKICNKNHYVECPVCHRQMIWNSSATIKPCSRKCTKELTKQKNLEKYGCEHPMQNKQVQQNHKQSMIEKYGVESPLQSESIKNKCKETMQSKFGVDWALSNRDVKEKASATMTEKYGAATTLQSDVLREKVKNTNLERYGVEHAMMNSSIHDKSVNTMIEKYGVENPMQLDSVKQQVKASRKLKQDEITEKARQTFLSRYGVDNPSKSPEGIQKIRQSLITEYGYISALKISELKESIPLGENYSYLRKFEVIEELNKYNVTYSIEKQLEGEIFDIAIEDKKILINVTTTYTNNIINNDTISTTPHLNKSRIAKQNGYRCIHVFDWDNVDKVINLVRPTVAVNARDLEIYKLRIDVATKFLNENHLQGSCRGQLLCLGLVKDNILYQVMTFGQSRYDSSHSVELLRLCTLSGYRVRGGASKLFKFATEDYGLNNIISYCDRSKFNGSVYKEIGMTRIRETPPQEIWSRGNKKITANLLRQRGYDQLFGTNYGKGTSNEALMIETGWLPVYDCGQLVFEYK